MPGIDDYLRKWMGGFSREVTLRSFRQGRLRLVAWVVFLAVVFMLGAIRTATDAEFAIASLAILPVLAMTWLCGGKSGFVAAVIAASMRSASDAVSGREFSADWIPWVNGVTYLMTYGLVVFLAAKLVQQLERERDHATHDALTGLSNRRAFLAAADLERERATRYGYSLAVIFLDLDDFKQLNDAQGHDVGDAALRATAEALSGVLRGSDLLARLGGDEFAIVLPESGYEAACDVGRKICDEVDRALANYSPVRASVGVAWFASVERTFHEMLKAADEVMYAAKARGKHGMCAHSFGAGKA